VTSAWSSNKVGNRKDKYAWGIPSMETYLTSIMIRGKNISKKDLFYLHGIYSIQTSLEKGRFYRENTYKCSPLVTKWQIILYFHIEVLKINYLMQMINLLTHIIKYLIQ
jgi:hypothetical protein